jgi:hypothetical protein
VATERSVVTASENHGSQAQAREAEKMTPSAIVSYAYEQIDQVRTELEQRR